MNAKTLQTAAAVAAVGAITQILITQLLTPRPALPSPANVVPPNIPTRF